MPGALLRPESVEDLLAHRWVRLRTFARFVPWSLRTLERWAATGKVPASRRGGDREWWVDLARLRAQRPDAWDEMFDSDGAAAA